MIIRSDIFQFVLLSVFKNSLVAGILILFIIGFKKILGAKLNVHLGYYIWLLLVVRLIIPFDFVSKYSVFNSVKPEVQQSFIESVGNLNLDRSFRLSNEPVTLKEYETSVNSSDANMGGKASNMDLIGVISYIWIIGVVICFLAMILIQTNIRIKIDKNKLPPNEHITDLLAQLRIDMGIRRRIPLILTEQINSAAILSILNPRIVMSPTISNKFTLSDIKYILRHELTHYKRKDLLILFIANVLCSIYWFNPLILYAFYRMESDCEASCDADVLKAMGQSDYTTYGLAIIKTLTIVPKRRMIMLNLGIGKTNDSIKRRIYMISKFKPNKFKSSTSFILITLAAALSVIFLSKPLSKEIIAAEASEIVAEDETGVTKVGSIENTKQAGVYYDEIGKRIVVEKTELVKSFDDIQHIDSYWDKKYELIVSGTSGEKSYNIESGLASKIVIQASEGIINISIYGNDIFALRETEDEKNLYFEVKKPSEVYEKVVIINPSHGGVDAGATGFDKISNSNLYEKDLSLKLAKEIENIYAQSNDKQLKIYLTRHTDINTRFDSIVAFAKRNGDVCINLHFSETGIYYNEFGSQLSEILETNLKESLDGLNFKSELTNVSLYTIMGLEIPAVDIEIARLDDQKIWPQITSDDFNEKAALAILNSLRVYFEFPGEFVKFG